MADMAVALWGRHLRHHPAQPQWADRDVSCCPTATSMLIYSLLQNFRQLHSKTPGHPEVGITPAWKPPPARWARASPTPWALRWLKTAGCRVQPRRPRHRQPPHLCLPGRRLPDGRHQPRGRALAGAWKLNKLIALYDDNGISIDGQVAPLVHRQHAPSACPKPTAGT